MPTTKRVDLSKYVPLVGKACKNQKVITPNGCKDCDCNCEWYHFPAEKTAVVEFLKNQNKSLLQKNEHLREEIITHKTTIDRMEEALLELEYKEMSLAS